MDNNNLEVPSLDEVFLDFEHPNPNLNKESYLNMVKYWPNESMERLLENLDNDNLIIKRKSVKALACFGGRVFGPVLQIFHANGNRGIRTSCLKVLVKVAAEPKNRPFPKRVMEIIEISILDESPEVILTTISLLRQLEDQGLPYLIKASKDRNILRATAAITAIGEIHDPIVEKVLKDIIQNNSKSKMILESASNALKCFIDQKSYGNRLANKV